MLAMIAPFHENEERQKASAINAPPHAYATKWANLSKWGMVKPTSGSSSPDWEESQ